MAVLIQELYLNLGVRRRPESHRTHTQVTSRMCTFTTVNEVSLSTINVRLLNGWAPLESLKIVYLPFLYLGKRGILSFLMGVKY